MGEQGGHPERRIGRIVKSMVLGRRPMTLVGIHTEVKSDRHV
ncbi:MAG: hypothetical protein RLY70_2036 [Planctomycetota bacterium]|jgi:hypothetical protein